MELPVVGSDQPNLRSIPVERPEARTRQELFRLTSSVVHDGAPTWGDRHTGFVVANPLLTRADVQSVFDEISEKHNVAGIALRFEKRPDERLQAIFEPGILP